MAGSSPTMTGITNAACFNKQAVRYIGAMKRLTRSPISVLKVSVKSRIARPRGKRSVNTIDKTSAETGDPFAVFTEWRGKADEKAYAKL